MTEPLLPDRDLDKAFVLPDLVVDPGLRELYEVIVARMRREASHLQMNTVQLLLIERIAVNYILLKYRESLPIGDAQGFAHATIQKDFNTFWLAMTSEFNKTIRGQDKEFRKQVADQVKNVLANALSATVPDQTIRMKFLQAVSVGMEEVGLA